MDLVVDSSVAMAWVLPDENSHAVERIFAHLGDEGEIFVPSLWWYEVSNVLAVARRSKRLTEAQCARALELLSGLPLQSEAPGAVTAGRLLDLTHRYGLSAYDAAYLGLAERRGVPLATFDRDLLKAARAAGVKTV